MWWSEEEDEEEEQPAEEGSVKAGSTGTRWPKWERDGKGKKKDLKQEPWYTPVEPRKTPTLLFQHLERHNFTTQNKTQLNYNSNPQWALLFDGVT